VAMTVVSILSTVDSHIIIIFFGLWSSNILQSWAWLCWALNTFLYGARRCDGHCLDDALQRDNNLYRQGHQVRFSSDSRDHHLWSTFFGGSVCSV
jgi:hypothetical protein